MRNTIVLALVTTIILSCGAQTGTETKKEIDLTNENSKVSYSLGVLVGSNLKNDGVTDIDADIVAAAIKDVLAGNELKIDKNAAQLEFQTYMQSQRAKGSEEAIKRGQDFLDKNKEREGVVVLPSGLQYEIMKEGTGPKPGPTDKVKTHYHGTLIDGTVFDSSVERGDPISFPVNGVIAGWTEALQLMPVGSKWKLFIPSNLAYGERGAGGAIGPNETLVFEVELLGIE